MTKNTLLVASDCQVWAGNPDKNYAGLGKLGVNTSTGTDQRATYLFFNRPFAQARVTVAKATLRMYQQGAATGGTRTLTVQRTDAPFTEGTLAWTGRPGGTGLTATKALGNSTTDGRLWEWDVTAIMQQVADGGSWNGLRVTSDLSTPIWFYSKESNVGAYVATLEVEWSDAPDAPTQCSPSDGAAVGIARPTFRMDYTDPSGEDGLQAVQVQVSTTNSTSGLVVDSGVVPSELPEWLCTTDLAVSSSLYYWRGQTQDAAGNWSGYSAWQSFRRTAKGALVLSNPTGTVYTPTPTWSWTWTPASGSGDTQRAYQVFVVDPADPTEVYYDSGKRTDAVTSFTMPKTAQLVLTPGQTYLTILRVWGTLQRVATPNDPVYVEAQATFTLGTSGSSAVSSLTVVDASPFAALTWSSSSTNPALEFVIIRDGKTVAIMDAADVLVSGTSYRFKDATAEPGTTHTWAVASKIGSTVANPVTMDGSVNLEGVWLFSLATVDVQTADLALCISGDPDPERMELEADEDVAIVTPAGASTATMIFTAGGVRPNRRRTAGTIKRADLAKWKRLTKNRTNPLGIMTSRTALQVMIYNVTTGDEIEFSDDIPVAFEMIVVG